MKNYSFFFLSIYLAYCKPPVTHPNSLCFHNDLVHLLFSQIVKKEIETWTTSSRRNKQTKKSEDKKGKLVKQNKIIITRQSHSLPRFTGSGVCTITIKTPTHTQLVQCLSLSENSLAGSNSPLLSPKVNFSISLSLSSLVLARFFG